MLTRAREPLSRRGRLKATSPIAVRSGWMKRSNRVGFPVEPVREVIDAPMPSGRLETGARVTERVQPKVYTIAPERPFLATLAGGLLGMTGGDPLWLPCVTILLPTRRAVRALRDAFLRATSQ